MSNKATPQGKTPRQDSSASTDVHLENGEQQREGGIHNSLQWAAVLLIPKLILAGQQAQHIQRASDALLVLQHGQRTVRVDVQPANSCKLGGEEQRCSHTTRQARSGAGASLVSRAATAADVLALFGPGKLFRQPTQVNKSVVITADTRNSADVWLILNNTDVTQVTDGVAGPQEIFHVAHLEGSWNASLVGILPVPLDPVLGV